MDSISIEYSSCRVFPRVLQKDGHTTYQHLQLDPETFHQDYKNLNSVLTEQSTLKLRSSPEELELPERIPCEIRTAIRDSVVQLFTRQHRSSAGAVERKLHQSVMAMYSELHPSTTLLIHLEGAKVGSSFAALLVVKVLG